MAGPRILITNDDGIHAPGIALLEKVAATLSDDVWVVAPAGVMTNVNFPAVAPHEVTGLRVTRQGARNLLEIHADCRTDARGFPYFWLKFHRDVGSPVADSDLAAIAAGAISVTPLHLDMTNRESIPDLRRALSDFRLDIAAP